MTASKTANEMKAQRQSKKHMKPFQDWEAVKENDYYVRCAASFLHHPAFLALTPAARMTLVYMRLEAAGKQDFRFPLSCYIAFISRSGFQGAVKQLVAHGFIEVTGRTRICANVMITVFLLHGNAGRRDKKAL